MYLFITWENGRKGEEGQGTKSHKSLYQKTREQDLILMAKKEHLNKIHNSLDFLSLEEITNTCIFQCSVGQWVRWRGFSFAIWYKIFTKGADALGHLQKC